MREFLSAVLGVILSAGTVHAQLEYIADWAPSPLPEIDFSAYPKVHYIHDFDGEPLYPADYSHVGYIDPDAPNGGTLRMAALGTFDSFNPIISRGQLAAGITELSVRLVDSNSDDIDSAYVVGAEYLQMPKDRSWVLYKIRDEMTWPNGDKVTPQDYIWTQLQRIEHSSTFGAGWNDELMAIQDVGDNRVLVRFNPENPSRNNPVQAGIFWIFPRYHFESEHTDQSLGKTFLEPYPGMGPYEIGRFKAGQFIEYNLKEDWWGFDVPALKSSYSKKIIYNYFGNRESQREAVKAGEIDLFVENSSKSWHLDWENVAAIEAGDLHKESIYSGGLKNPQMFVLNLRREPFDNRLVRKALDYAFDFETTNNKIFFKQYSRTKSIFQNSDLQAKGLPSKEETAILQELFDTYGEKYVPKDVFGEAYQPPTTDGNGNVRDNLRTALTLMAQAGWTLNSNGELVNGAGEQMTFEIKYRSATDARYIDPWIENLRTIGINASGRLMEPNAWWDNVRNRDFDVTTLVISSTYTGYLLYWTWGSHMKNNPQSRATAGLDNPAVDDIGKRLLNASTRQEVNLLARVADRLLIHNHVGILQWHAAISRLVWWDKFNKGEYIPEYGGATSGWYIDERKEAALVGRSGYSLN